MDINTYLIISSWNYDLVSYNIFFSPRVFFFNQRIFKRIFVNQIVTTTCQITLENKVHMDTHMIDLKEIMIIASKWPIKNFNFYRFRSRFWDSVLLGCLFYIILLLLAPFHPSLRISLIYLIVNHYLKHVDHLYEWCT